MAVTRKGQANGVQFCIILTDSDPVTKTGRVLLPCRAIKGSQTFNRLMPQSSVLSSRWLTNAGLSSYDISTAPKAHQLVFCWQ